MSDVASRRIVVGVDGSATSKAALGWALNEARLRRVGVEAIHVWQAPSLALSHFGGEPLPVIAPDDVEKASDQLLLKTVREVAGADCDVPVTATLAKGHPAKVLVNASKEAELLVVGSRGRGGFAGMLLGSVSNHAVNHALCPVVVIRT